VRALTLTQPWADLVVDGEKRIETRSWSIGYRGPLAIHASKAMTQDAWDLVMYLRHALRRRVDPSQRGMVLGTVDLIDVVRIMPPRGAGPHRGWHRDSHRTDIPLGMRWELTLFEEEVGDFTPGRFAWLLANPVRFPEPIPAVGHLGVWEWEEPA
jgi:hypothetical protein